MYYLLAQLARAVPGSIGPRAKFPLYGPRARLLKGLVPSSG